MDPQLLALAMSGGTTLVGLMATNAWEQSKGAVKSLFARFKPASIEEIEAALDASQQAVLAADQVGDLEARQEVAQEWQGRFRRFLRDYPEAASSLQDSLTEMRETLQREGVNLANTINIQGNAYDSGRVYQQGQGIQRND